VNLQSKLHARPIAWLLLIGVLIPTLAISAPFPQDERSTMGRNYIASDSGSIPNSIQRLDIDNTPLGNTDGNYYESCFTSAFFHPQHIVRLRNKNGRAYFVVAHSKGLGGDIQVIRTDPERLDPTTDLINPAPGFEGEYIWMERFDASSEVGHWNHPGKMALMGDTLIVTAQNWSEGLPVGY